MTEQVLAEPNLQNQSITPSDVSPAPSAQSQVAEKMIPQSEVERIVKGRYADAFDKGKREAMAELQKQQPQQYQPEQAHATNNSMGGMSQVSETDIQRMVDQRMQQQSQNAAAQHVVNQFIQKMESGKGKYDDFEQSVAKLNLPNIPEVLQLANSTDNTADVMYDLSKNPQNVVKLRQLHQISPQLAFEEMQKLSASIKQNDAAQQQKTANEPLGQINHSTTGADNGSLSVRDYKKQDWLRA